MTPVVSAEEQMRVILARAMAALGQTDFNGNQLYDRVLADHPALKDYTKSHWLHADILWERVAQMLLHHYADRIESASNGHAADIPAIVAELRRVVGRMFDYGEEAQRLDAVLANLGKVMSHRVNDPF